VQTSGSARRSGAKRVQLDGVANRSPSRFPVGAAPPLLPALNPYRPPIERQLRPPACHKVQLASTSTPPGPPSWQPSRNRPATATIPEAIVSRRVDTRDRIAASSLSDRLDRDSRSDQGVTPAGQQFAHVSIGRDEQPTGQARSTQSPATLRTIGPTSRLRCLDPFGTEPGVVAEIEVDMAAQRPTHFHDGPAAACGGIALIEAFPREQSATAAMMI
jgi:hypothetical protein